MQDKDEQPIKQEWEKLKLQFSALSCDVGALEYEKQRKLTEMIVLEQKIKEFWEKNKEILSANQQKTSGLSS